VALIRFSVAAETGVPSAWWWRMAAVNIACTCAAESSASSTGLRYGAKYSRTWAVQLRSVDAAEDVRDTSQYASQSPTVKTSAWGLPGAGGSHPGPH
jgi:hypothetical protein